MKKFVTICSLLSIVLAVHSKVNAALFTVDFRYPTFTSSGITLEIGKGFVWNNYVEPVSLMASWKFLYPGTSYFRGTFNLDLVMDLDLTVTHLSSYSSGCSGGGYSPIDIVINDSDSDPFNETNLLLNNYDVEENHLNNSQGFETDTFKIPAAMLRSGLNTITFAFEDNPWACSHYWIQEMSAEESEPEQPWSPDVGCIASGETKTGSISPTGDTDLYTFYGQTGQNIVIEMANIYTIDALYPRLQLYGPNGVRVAEATDSCTWHNRVAKIENYQLNMNGIYTIVASNGCGLATGKYNLSLILVPDATTSPQDPNGGDISSGDTKTGNISPGGDTDAYAFYGLAGQGVVIEMADIYTKGALGALYPRLQIYDPNSVRVAEATDNCASHERIAKIENYQLKMTGIYTIVVSNACGVAKGEYGLSLSLMPPSDPYGLYPYGPQPPEGQSISYCYPNQPFDIVIENRILPDGSVVKRRSGGNYLSWWSVIRATSYDVYLTSSPCMPMEKMAENIINPWVAMPALKANEVYYWQVIARTPDGDIKGPVWWFSTEPCTSPSCTLTVSAIGQGTITDPNVGINSYPCGQVVPVTAVADIGYEFVRWEGTAVDVNKAIVEYQNATGSKILVTVDGAYTLRAVFEDVIYDFPLDSNPGWSMNGQWGFGTPTGRGGTKYGNPDPTSGHTGQNVLGVNLNGDYDVGIGGPYSLVAGPFDLSGYNDVKLRYWRWLNTDWAEYVKNSLEMSIDGWNWTILWQNPERADIADRAWTRFECDIGSWPDNQSTIYLRWSHQIVKERANAYSGWNLDDIQLIGRK